MSLDIPSSRAGDAGASAKSCCSGTAGAETTSQPAPRQEVSTPPKSCCSASAAPLSEPKLELRAAPPPAASSCCASHAEVAPAQTARAQILAEAPAQSCCSTSAEVRTAPQPQPGLLASLARYQPILIIAGAALAGSAMLAAASHDSAMLASRLMGAFMGLFLLPLALLKLFDLRGFAASFTRYDVLAKAWPPYARIYPFAELALALLFLSGLLPVVTNLAAIAIGAVGTVGIVRSLSRGEQLRCACVGSVIDVPLGAVSITENAGMAIMAALMLAM